MALKFLFYASYACGMNNNSTFPAASALFSVICSFTGTKITYYQRGGDGGSYIRNGYILIVGA